MATPIDGLTLQESWQLPLLRVHGQCSSRKWLDIPSKRNSEACATDKLPPEGSVAAKTAPDLRLVRSFHLHHTQLFFLWHDLHSVTTVTPKFLLSMAMDFAGVGSGVALGIVSLLLRIVRIQDQTTDLLRETVMGIVDLAAKPDD
jgi:hypothetical protein